VGKQLGIKGRMNVGSEKEGPPGKIAKRVNMKNLKYDTRKGL